MRQGKKWKKFLLYVQSVLCALLAALPAAAAIRIYREGLALRETEPLAWIFTREKAAEALTPLAALLLVSLPVTIAGLCFQIRDRDRSVPDAEALRDLTVRRVAVPSVEMNRERTRQGRLRLGGWIGFALCMVPVLLYVTDGRHFPEGDLEAMFLALLGRTLPWIALGVGALATAGVLREKSMRREIEAAKEQLTREKSAGVHPPEPSRKAAESSARLRLARLALLALALCLIAAGVANGGAGDVFGKAVNICTECVGLG